MNLWITLFLLSSLHVVMGQRRIVNDAEVEPSLSNSTEMHSTIVTTTTTTMTSITPHPSTSLISSTSSSSSSSTSSTTPTHLPSNSKPYGSDEGGLTIGSIIGIAVACATILAAIIGLVMIRSNKRKFNNMDAEMRMSDSFSSSSSHNADLLAAAGIKTSPRRSPQPYEFNAAYSNQYANYSFADTSSQVSSQPYQYAQHSPYEGMHWGSDLSHYPHGSSQQLMTYNVAPSRSPHMQQSMPYGFHLR